MSSIALIRLLQLASPTLPVGAYSYSQGLEAAVDAGEVHDEATAGRWIGDLLAHVLPRGELAVLVRLLHALPGDRDAFSRWQAWWRATRETRELRAETDQVGTAMTAWLRDAARAPLPAAARDLRLAWPAAFAVAAHADGIAIADAAGAYAFAWLENQVLAAVKLVPLGQAAGQRVLRTLAASIPGAVTEALTVEDDELAAFAPGLALASSRHETQYTRLFRS